MERSRRSILGWIAIGLGVLALVGVFVGARHRSMDYSYNASRFADRSGAYTQEYSQQDRFGPGPQQGFRSERQEQFRAGPHGDFHGRMQGQMRHERGRGMPWWLVLPLMLLGSILRFALFAAVAYVVVRWLQKRDAARDRQTPPPSDPPYTGGTTSL
ncbi:MAG: hypothetical protein OHK0022_56430 [Roseiflexaceae bacterium]